MEEKAKAKKKKKSVRKEPPFTPPPSFRDDFPAPEWGDDGRISGRK